LQASCTRRPSPPSPGDEHRSETLVSRFYPAALKAPLNYSAKPSGDFTIFSPLHSLFPACEPCGQAHPQQNLSHRGCRDDEGGAKYTSGPEGSGHGRKNQRAVCVFQPMPLVPLVGPGKLTDVIASRVTTWSNISACDHLDSVHLKALKIGWLASQGLA
jgi:hypothetical protein